jgi:hypothetical protein
MMNPQFQDDTAVNPFDMWGGANFKLKIRKVDGYPNYDKCEFETPGPLLDDDDELERIWKSEYSLKEMHDPKNFKTYQELKTRLERTLGAAPAATRNTVVENDDVPWDPEPAASAPSFKSAMSKPAPTKAAVEDDDDDMAFFKSLADED